MRQIVKIWVLTELLKNLMKYSILLKQKEVKWTIMECLQYKPLMEKKSQETFILCSSKTFKKIKYLWMQMEVVPIRVKSI